MGPLHGMPQAIKDLAAAKGIPFTQGSPINKDTIAADDALFVERMRNAGAIIIGKTNVPEFGLGSQSYNPVFGMTRNAYDQSKTSGGSSGGAAVALALRMLPVADGSDHGGSLRNPAAFNNVLGFRTSYGRVPHHHEDVFLTGLSVKGPMARTVEDLQMLLSVQAGYDDRVPLSIENPHSYKVPSLKCDVKGKRIGWLGEFGNLPMEAGVRELCRDALRTLEGMGCIVEEAKPDFDAETVWKAWLVLRAWMAGAKLRPHYDNPANTRADEAGSAVGGRGRLQALGLRHHGGLRRPQRLVQGGPPAVPALRLPDAAERVGVSRSRSRRTGRRRSRARRWTPITAGCRW